MIGKVCGITCREDLDMALAAGADLLGFLCHATSPRHCRDLRLADQAGEKAVMVLVARNVQHLMETVEQTGCLWVQPYLEADCRAEGISTLQASGRRVILPWPDRSGNPVLPADLFLWECNPDNTGLLGGSGQTHAMAFPPPGPFLLAGGLDGDSVLSRFQALSAAEKRNVRGFDAASRLESAPGRKSPERVKSFLQSVRTIEAALCSPGG